MRWQVQQLLNRPTEVVGNHVLRGRAAGLSSTLAFPKGTVLTHFPWTFPVTLGVSNGNHWDVFQLMLRLKEESIKDCIVFAPRVRGI